jgi:hypothetical protein
MALFAALGWLLAGAALGQASGDGAAGKPGTAGGAADSRRDAAGSKADVKTPKPSAVPKVLPGGSGETPAQRSARLKRECKGRPDAGACSGYTQ